MCAVFEWISVRPTYMEYSDNFMLLARIHGLPFFRTLQLVHIYSVPPATDLRLVSSARQVAVRVGGGDGGSVIATEALFSPLHTGIFAVPATAKLLAFVNGHAT